jgi:hypothetical protein
MGKQIHAWRLLSTFLLTNSVLLQATAPPLPPPTYGAPYDLFHLSEQEDEQRVLSALERIMDGTESTSSSHSDSYSSDLSLSYQSEQDAYHDSAEGAADEESGLHACNKTRSLTLDHHDRSINDHLSRKQKSKVKHPNSRKTKTKKENDSKQSELLLQSTANQSTLLDCVPLPFDYQATTAKKAPTLITPRLSHTLSVTTPWVRRFLASCHKDALLPIPRDYWTDHFNLAQLPSVIESIARSSCSNNMETQQDTPDTTLDTSKPSYPWYRAALTLITQDDPVPLDIPHPLQQAATALYLLVHQRYVLSPRGLDSVRRRFLYKPELDAQFGKCPSLACHGMPLLPYGDSSDFTVHWLEDQHDNDNDDNTSSLCYATAASTRMLTETRAKRYCASCQQVYYHWDSHVDGCAWGPSFAPLFLLTYPDLLLIHFGRRPFTSVGPPPPLIPRVFGFALHPTWRQHRPSTGSRQSSLW